MHIVPDYVPADGPTAEGVSSRLRAFDYSLTVWERKKAQAEAKIAEFTEARERFIGRLPELPVWITERGEIGAECPDDAA